MAFPGLMYKGFFQYGREAVWGTDVAATHRLRFTRLTPEVGTELIPSDVMDGTGLMLQYLAGKKSVRFTIECELTYSNFMLLLDCLMGTGTYAANGGSTTGAGPYVHTWRHGDLLNSLTLEIGMGDIPTGKVEQIVGAKIVEARFSGASHERVMATLTFEGKDFSYNVTPSTVLSPTLQDCVRFDDITTTTDGNGDDATFVGFELSINNNAPGRDHASVLIAEPIRNGFPDITYTVRQEFQSINLLGAQLAVSVVAPILRFTSGSTFMQFNMPDSRLEPVRREAEGGKGRIIYTLNYKPIASGTPKSYIVITNQNAQALITTYGGS